MGTIVYVGLSTMIVTGYKKCQGQDLARSKNLRNTVLHFLKGLTCKLMARKIDAIPPLAWKIWQNESIAVRF